MPAAEDLDALREALAKANKEEAVEIGLRILADAPDDAGTMRRLGYAYQALGRHEEAVDMLRRSLVLESSSTLARVTMAEELTALGRLDEAATELDVAQKGDRDDKYADDLREARSKLQEARAAAQSAAAANKVNPVKAILGPVIEVIATILSVVSGLRLVGLVVSAVILAGAWWFLSTRHADAVERERAWLEAAAKRPAGKLARATDLYYDTPLINTYGDQPIARSLPKGTVVEPIARVGQMLQVRLPATEERGLVDRKALAEYAELVARSDTDLFLVDPAVGGRWRHNQLPPAEKRKPVAKGTRARMLEMREGVDYKVKLADGRVGWVEQGTRGMMPVLDVEIPFRSREFSIVVADEVFEQQVVGKPMAEVMRTYGPPDTYVIDDARAGKGRAWYGLGLSVVVGSRRHAGALLELEGSKVARFQVLPESRWVLAEALPGSDAVRALDVRGTLFDAPRFDPGDKDAKKGQGWVRRLLVGLVLLVVTLVLIASVPQAVSSLPRAIAGLLPLPNPLVIALDWLLLAATTYFYFLFFAIHVDGREQMSLFLAHDLLFVVVGAGFLFFSARNLRFLLYHRCPAC